MRDHLLIRPIESFSEPVQVLKETIVAHRGCIIAGNIVLDEFHVNFLGQRVKADKLALLNRKNVDLLVAAASNRKLQVSFITCSRNLPFRVSGLSLHLLRCRALRDVTHHRPYPATFITGSLYTTYSKCNPLMNYL